jgi:hypothetical protein
VKTAARDAERAPVDAQTTKFDAQVLARGTKKDATTSTSGICMPALTREEEAAESESEKDDEEEEESSQMSRLLRVVSGEDTDEQDDDLRMQDCMNVIRAFEREHSATDAAEVETSDELWAERWEAEQFARQQRRNEEKILVTGARKKQVTEAKTSKPPGLKLDSLTELFKSQEPRGAMGDVDAEGALRGPCKICDKACVSFAKLSSWKRAPLPNHDVRSV